jgi:hypothetical protein
MTVQLSGSRGFIRRNLADVTTGPASLKEGGESITVLSPFGLARWI